MILPSKILALVGVFSALHSVLYFSSVGLWRSWSIYLIPLEGIILGPWIGFGASMIGSIVARAIKPTDLWMFGIISEPLGVLACGLMARKSWKPLLAIYSLMLIGFLFHPLGRQMPFWTILDVVSVFALIYPVTRIVENLQSDKVKSLSIAVCFVSLIGIVTDSLARIFLLIPLGLYRLFAWSPEVLYIIFTTGAIDSYIEDLLVVLVSVLIGGPTLKSLRKIPGIKYPIS